MYCYLLFYPCFLYFIEPMNDVAKSIMNVVSMQKKKNKNYWRSIYDVHFISDYLFLCYGSSAYYITVEET